MQTSKYEKFIIDDHRIQSVKFVVSTITEAPQKDMEAAQKDKKSQQKALKHIPSQTLVQALDSTFKRINFPS